MKLSVLSHEGGGLRIACADDVTLLELNQNNDPLEPLLGPPGYSGTVLLSLEKSAYMDSAGVGWLLVAHKHFRDAGGRLIVHSLAPMVAHVFRILAIEHIMEVAADEAAALRLLQAAPVAVGP